VTESAEIISFSSSRDLVSKEDITTAVQLWRFDRDLSEALTRQEIGAMTFMQRIDAQRKTLIMGFAVYLRKHPRSDVAMGVYLITTLLSDNDRGQCTVSQPTMAKLFGRSVSSIADAQRRLREDGMVITGKGRYAGSTPVMPRLATLQHNNLTWIIGALAADDATVNHPAPLDDCQSSGPTGSLPQSSGRPEGLKTVNHPVEPVSIIRPDPMQSLSNNSVMLKRVREAEEQPPASVKIAASIAFGVMAATSPLPAAAAPEPTPITQPAKLSLSQMIDQMADAAGPAIGRGANLLMWSDLQQWLRADCDFELDILQTIKAVSARHLERGQPPIGSWSYFTKAIANAKATRLKPMDTGQPQPKFQQRSRPKTVDEMSAEEYRIHLERGFC